MQVSKTTDFALRVLLFAGSNPDELVTQAQMAEFFDISHEHLRKVVHELAQHGFLKTYRGRGGGLQLGRTPDRINLGEVVDLFERRGPIIACEKLDCPLARRCYLKDILEEGSNAFIDTIRKYTLADVLEDRRNPRALMAR